MTTRVRLFGAAIVIAAVALVMAVLGHHRAAPVAAAPAGEPGAVARPSFAPLPAPEARPEVRRQQRRRIPRFAAASRSRYADLPVAPINLVPPAVSVALSKVSRAQPREEMREGLRCLRDYGARHPADLDEDGWWSGALALTLDVRNGRARVVDVAGMRGEDDDTVECAKRRIKWLTGVEFPMEGAPDGITRVEWTYMVGTRS